MEGAYHLPYEPPVYEGPELSARIINAKIYTEACHCGAVKLMLKTKGLMGEGSEEIKECSCDICLRVCISSLGIAELMADYFMQRGTILIQPFSDQVRIEGEENLTSYIFGRGSQSYEFCKICGVDVYTRRLDVKEEERGKSVGKAESLEAWRRKCQVNLRCFEGMEWKEVKKLVWRDDEE
jgi:hypothetical protein